MNLDYVTGVKLINKATEKEQEHYAWQMWLTKYPYMDKKTFVPFDKFYRKQKRPKVVTTAKSTGELLEMAERIKQVDQRR